jgi:uncharacterized repeat protein (TIGR01451 family)
MKTRIRTFSPITIKMVLALLLAAAALGTLLVRVAQAAPGNGTYYADTFLTAGDVPGDLAGAPSPAGPAAPANGPTFTAVVTDALTSVYGSSVAWGDYDNDGDLDILLTGNAASGRVSRVYRNDGADTFTAAVTDTLTGVEGGSAAWGDYDGDGDLDILLAGFAGLGNLVARVYRNDGSDTFVTAVTTDTLLGVESSSVAWGDYDNDGDLDILLTGLDGLGPDAITAVYRNDGGNAFTEAVTDTLMAVAEGSVAWGDYDNDGDLDALLTGSDFEGAPAAAVYRNEGNDTFSEIITDALTGVTDSSAAWGDYDNDGDLDILLTGSGSSGRVASVYRNDGGDGPSGGWVFTAAVTDTLAGISLSSVAWGDYDNDGDLDILLTGNAAGGRISRIYRNDTAATNTVPAAPSGLSAEQAADDAVVLSWSAPPPTATTPITGLTYNLYVGTAPGKADVVPPMAFTTTASLTNGLRLLPAMGNGQHGLTATLTGLAEGTYYWSVQAVDHTFAGSLFAAEASFVILPPFFVESVAPAPNSHSAAVTTNLTVTVSSLVSPTTVTTQTFVVHGGFQGHLDGALSFGSTVTRSVFAFDPAGTLHPGELIQASVSSGILESDGDPIRPAVWQFRTAVRRGSGLFVDSGQSLGSSGSYDVALGDVDGDGDLDGFVANHNQPNKVWLNDGTGTFSDSGQSLGSSYSRGVALGDVDGDGDLDGFVANGSGLPNKVWLNDGTGTFVDSGQSLGSATSFGVALGDVDGDGDLDGFVANWNGQPNKVWFNQNAVDLSLVKAVNPEVVAPGQAITYTIAYTNHGPDGAIGVLITDVVPITLTNVSFDSSGATITETGSVSTTWEVASLSPGQGGVITITAVVSPLVEGTFGLTNQASITAALILDPDPDDNTSVVTSTIDGVPPLLPALVSPANGALTSDTTPTLAWQASPSPDVAGYLLDLDGAVADVGNIIQYTATVLADGSYTWTVAAYDQARNTSAYTDTWSFTVDGTPPQVVDTAPSGGETGVGLDAPVVITFDEVINGATFVYAVTPDPGGWAETWSASGSVVTLTHAAFSAGTIYTVTVAAADDLAGNALSSAPLTWQFTTYNQPPLANAGLAQTVNTNALVTLDGSGSNDPDGHLPLTYGWTQTGGPAVTLSNPAAVAPTFSAPSNSAVLTFTLAVTDSLGLSGPTSDEVVITVEGCNIYLPLVVRQDESSAAQTGHTHQQTPAMQVGFVSKVGWPWSMPSAGPPLSLGLALWRKRRSKEFA